MNLFKPKLQIIILSSVFVLSACGGDGSGGDSVESKNDPNTVDSIDPIITLIGRSTIEVPQDTRYIDAGANATDNIDGNISSDIIVSGESVNTSATPGTTFTIIYNVSDAAGNPAIEVTRTVSIVEFTRHIPDISEADIQHYLSTINTARAEARTCGNTGNFPAVSPVTWNDKLYKAAYEHSQDMTESNTFSHDGSGTVSDWSGYDLNKKSSMSDRVASYDYTWSRLSENLTAGTLWDTPEEAIQSWIDSPDHCHNLMDPNVTEVGMALTINTNTKYTHYWTQNFGTPR